MAPPVLVIESDPAIRRMLQVMLDLEGYRVRAAADGATGLDLLRESDEPHVVLVNYLMPDVDGFAVLAAAVADPALCRHRYVLMSSCASCHRQPRICMPHELLPKPFTMERLLTSVEAAAGSLSEAAMSESPIYGRASGEHVETGQPPLLLTFAARSAISRRRGRIVVRARPGAIVTLTLRDEVGRELWRPELSSAQMADELGYCRWRWIHRPRGGELTVEARAEWRGQHATVARTFELGLAPRVGR
jgi:CheY-like chemotaxis protein